MPSCAVAKCGNWNRKTKGTEIKYFRFPKDNELSKKWIVACRREDKINLKNACLCSEHFDAASFEIPLKERLLNYTYKNSRHLKPDAIPTLNLPVSYHKQENKRQIQERSDRISKRIRRNEVNEILKAESSVSCDGNYENITVENSKSIATNVELLQVDSTSELIRAQVEIEQLKKALTAAEDDKTRLENKIKHYDDVLSTVFTRGQIKKLLCLDKTKKVHWSPDDIASAISLRSVSPKAYRYLRTHNYPLPAMSTLRKWVSNFNVNPGVLKSVLTLLNEK